MRTTCLALGLLSLSASAAAQTVDLGPRDRGFNRFASPQNFALELRGGPWTPNVDSEFGGTTGPYRELFGDSPRVQFAVEFDWQLLRINPIGSLGFGIQGGYAWTSRPARITERASDGSPALGAETGQDTTLNVMPLTALAVVRIDGLARNTVIPLVPYAKIGLQYAAWWVTFGDNLARLNSNSPLRAGEDPGLINRAANGGSLGLMLAAGLALQMDMFEPSAQRAWDTTMGVNHSYLFAEWSITNTGSLGRANQLNLGQSNWVLGVALEF